MDNGDGIIRGDNVIVVKLNIGKAYRKNERGDLVRDPDGAAVYINKPIEMVDLIFVDITSVEVLVDDSIIIIDIENGKLSYTELPSDGIT